MTEIRFYHMESVTLDEVLPAILSKAISTGRRVVVKAADDMQVDRLNTHLWTYDPNSFIPHGAGKDGNAADQPVWLTTQEENPNSADVLILVNGAQSQAQGDYALCCEMLDGRNLEEISAARARWKTYKDAGHDVSYYQQGTSGWEKKA